MSAKGRRRRTQQQQQQVKVAFGNDDDDDKNETVINHELSDESNQTVDKNSDDIDSDKVYERGFFTIENTTVEVILENDVLTWSNITGGISFNETSRKKSTQQNDNNTVNLHNVFAITPINQNSWGWSINSNENANGLTISTVNNFSAANATSSSLSNQNNVLRGFQLHSYQTLPDNVLQEVLIIFQSNESNQIERWFQLLSKIISEFRPTRHILVVCHPYAGSRHSRHIYNTKVKSILERALYKITYLEIDDLLNADEVFNHFEGDFDSIDSLVIIGGDGSVINVINALIRYSSKQNRITLDIENDLPAMPFPICIVPEGTTNIISHTIYGTTDHCTPLLHLILNQKMKIDMSAIYDENSNFVTANFSAAAGYPAAVLKYFPRYSLHSPKTIIKKSFAKGASHKNLHPILFEIRYVPATQNAMTMTRCYHGCSSCTPEATEKSDDRVKAFDQSHIQKLHQRKKTIGSNIENNRRLSSAEKEKPWKTLNNEYLQVAVFTNANLWSYAPQGLAKYGHIADGFLDLVLIEPVVRKEFIRYIKRNGNSKDQYDFPFTKTIKAKEVEIVLSLPKETFPVEFSNNNNNLDSSVSDDLSNEDLSDNENKISNTQKLQPHPPSAPISEESRRHRRRNHRISEQIPEPSQRIYQSSKSVETPRNRKKNLLHQQSENEMDNSHIDPYGSTTSLRPSRIFQSFKSKKDKIPLPRPSSASGREPDDEKFPRKSRKSFGGTLRPARSLLNLLSGNNHLPSGKNEKSSMNVSRDSFSSGIGRRPSVNSRSSSVDNSKTTITHQNKKPCIWNLNFTPYDSPSIRIKCFYRYLQVYGLGLSPDTRLKEINYSCFGRIG